MMREPVAAAQTRQVRVASNILMNNDFFYSSLNCVNSKMQVNLGFAQSSLINIENHNVVSEL